MKILIFSLFFILFQSSALADGASTERLFNELKNEPTLLRNFIFNFPKGGDLHNHLDGAIYAESFIAWAASDGKCIDLKSYMVIAPPCNAETGRPSLSSVQTNSAIVNPIIDALSVRNYERRTISGHDQFFSTFRRFFEAGRGHEGHMLAEVSARAAKQNIVYLELMQSWGMGEARALVANNPDINLNAPLSSVINNTALEALAEDTIHNLNQIELQWRSKLACETKQADPGCEVPVRYLAQVLRVFPREEVLAQTILAYKLISKDPRYVGLNFVAPEDHPVALRDYQWQMQMIGDLAELFPEARKGITLHAGEVVMGLVPPEDLGWHIREAIETAGARRIGHGIDVFYDSDSPGLMQMMAEKDILVEINLTSNDVILGVKDDNHPFNAYRHYQVPMVFSTDDEGVSRIDLSHEYQRAVETYDLSYEDIKYYSRNALAYSFIAGESLFADTRTVEVVNACKSSSPGSNKPNRKCARFLKNNEKARWQWDLEKRFQQFESRY